jgi:hypothetical protein
VQPERFRAAFAPANDELQPLIGGRELEVDDIVDIFVVDADDGITGTQPLPLCRAPGYDLGDLKQS